MEYSKALSFIWEDPRWQQKMLIGTGVMIASIVLSFVLVGILGFLIAMGYCVRLLQNVRNGQPHPLPEWDQWGEDLARGFKLFVVSIVWSLPIIVLLIPSGIGSAMANSRSDGVQMFGVLVSITTSCLSILYGLFIAVISPGFSIAFAEDEQIMSGLQFRDILAWTQDHIGQVIVVALIYIVASVAISLVASIVGVLLCLVGLIVTIPAGTLVTYLFQYHLFGQLAYAYPYGGTGGVRSTGTGPVSPSGVGTTPSGTTVPSDTTTTTGSATSSSTPPAAPATPPGEMAPGVEPGIEPPTREDDTEYPGSGVDDQPKS